MKQISFAMKEKHSRQYRVFLKVLSCRERMAILREFPFVKERNALLQTLKQRGVSYYILSRCSGLSLPQLYRIVRGGRENEREGHKKFKQST